MKTHRNKKSKEFIFLIPPLQTDITGRLPCRHGEDLN